MPVLNANAFTSGSILTVGQYLTPGQYITSYNGLYFAGVDADGSFQIWVGKERTSIFRMAGAQYQKYSIDTDQGNSFYGMLQEDGNFVVYQGDVPNNDRPVWGIEKAWFLNPTGNGFFAVMQDDGNFVVYQGQVGDFSTPIWASNTWMNLKSVSINNVQYDFANAVISDKRLASSVQQTINNGSSVDQTQSFSYEVSYTTSSSYTLGASQTSSMTAGISMTISAGTPLFDVEASSSLEVSQSSTSDWSSGTETTQENKYSGTLPVVAPPYSSINCTAQVVVANMSVPFTGEGTYTFISQDGGSLTVNGPVKGLYTGTSAYSQKTNITQQPASIAKLAA
jgi:hypothetical protein